MATETVNLEFLARQAKLNMDELRLLRRDVADMMRLLNANYELTRRIERREIELRDDIELMVKIELGGALTHLQTSVEASLARIGDTVGGVVARLDALEDGP